MKKALSLLLVLVMCLSLCACSGSKEKDTIDTESEAISAAKSYYTTANNIASDLGFLFYSDPNYGVCAAEMNDTGNWTVTLKGNMSGYTNETKTDFDLCGFEYTATVWADGVVVSGKAKRVD